jgi:hypothetical protein
MYTATAGMVPSQRVVFLAYASITPTGPISYLAARSIPSKESFTEEDGCQRGKHLCGGNLANLKYKEPSPEVRHLSVLHNREALAWHIVNSSATHS